MKGATAITQACPLCGKIETNAVPTNGYLMWKRGMLIQKAMPDVSECIREFLITGFCEDCREENDKISKQIDAERD